jgi:trans-aconitate 2-methyltransferase
LWNPEQYGRFRDERSRPFFDLLGLVQQRPGMRVADLGCGPGELTRDLHETIKAQETVGVDNSQEMLVKSHAYAGHGVSFEHADLREFAERPANESAFDLVFSNAAMQWVPDQPNVIAHLTKMLAPGGQLAIQVPANQDHPSHATIREVVTEPPFREALDSYVRHFSNLTPDGYANLLDRLGFPQQHVRLQVYIHHLADRADVVEWVRGSILTDYQKRLSPEMFEAFLERYRQKLMPQFEDRHPFLYTFQRILVWGSLAAP